MIQETLVYITVGIALIFLLSKIFIKPKKKSKCGTDCAC